MARTATKPELPEPKKPPEPVHWIGEPARLCRNCEHYEVSKTSRNRGSCHNGISGRLMTDVDSNCMRGWYPCIKRWPLEKRIHGTA